MSEKNRRRARLFLVQVFLVSVFLMAWEVYRTGHERAANRRLAKQVQQAQLNEESASGAASASDKGAAGGTGEGAGEGAGKKTAGNGEAGDGREAGQGPENGMAGNGEEGDRNDASGNGEGESAVRELTAADILPQYRALWEENNDLAGWLCIEDTVINYPVMYTPGDSEYYLHRAFDRSESVSGSLFIGAGWSENTNHVIIYGHHMRNKTMFGNLDKYTTESYAKEHPLIRFDTLTEQGEYEVLTAFYSRIYDLEEVDVFRYYRHIDLSSQESFDKYIHQVKEAALYDLGVEVSYGDSILTLSTCSYHTEDGRFVVVAKKVPPKALQEETLLFTP